MKAVRLGVGLGDTLMAAPLLAGRPDLTVYTCWPEVCRMVDPQMRLGPREPKPRKGFLAYAYKAMHAHMLDVREVPDTSVPLLSYDHNSNYREQIAAKVEAVLGTPVRRKWGFPMSVRSGSTLPWAPPAPYNIYRPPVERLGTTEGRHPTRFWDRFKEVSGYVVGYTGDHMENPWGLPVTGPPSVAMLASLVWWANEVHTTAGSLLHLALALGHPRIFFYATEAFSTNELLPGENPNVRIIL